MLRVEKVTHRTGAIWPFTVVGRPPQEDTLFGELIHELTGPLVPTVLPGVRAVHAVDWAGVHPLLFAIGSERYVPYARAEDGGARPMELLTQASAILGQGQMSLAKYLFIACDEDDRGLDIHDVAGFLQHVLARFDPRRDLHFHTNTTIDTLDYSGAGLNQGSKVVIAARGPARRTLAARVPAELALPEGFGEARVALPGVLAVPLRRALPQEVADLRLRLVEEVLGPLLEAPVAIHGYGLDVRRPVAHLGEVHLHRVEEALPLWRGDPVAHPVEDVLAVRLHDHLPPRERHREEEVAEPRLDTGVKVELGQFEQER